MNPKLPFLVYKKKYLFYRAQNKITNGCYFVSSCVSLNTEESMIDSISEMPVGTGVLAFQYLSKTLRKWAKGSNALDYGCGMGRSSRFLQSLGFNVTGIDVSNAFIQKARSNSNNIKYLKIDSPHDLASKLKDKYDLVLFSFVFVEVSSLDKIHQMILESKKLLSEDGVIAIVSPSDHFYYGNWATVNTNFPQNINASSGDIVKVHLTSYSLDIYDYYWKELDYETLFERSNVELIDKVFTKGDESSPFQWKEEKLQAPFVIYVLK